MAGGSEMVGGVRLWAGATGLLIGNLVALLTLFGAATGPIFLLRVRVATGDTHDVGLSSSPSE